MRNFILMVMLFSSGCATAPRPLQILNFNNSQYSIKASVTSYEAIRNYGDACILVASFENYGSKDYSGGFAKFMLITDDKDSITQHISFQNGLVGGGKPYVVNWIGWQDRTCPKLQKGTVELHPM